MIPSAKLISYTPDALELLLYTKNTRLQGAQSLEDIKGWSEKEKLDHLYYMRHTIKSSWEFVDFVFQIKGVDRAFTHQLVRTRHGSYAQQSQRTVDVRDSTWEPMSTDSFMYDHTIKEAISVYGKLIDAGHPVQDARGVLPTAIHTEIIAKFNLRTLHEMAQVRLCKRTQGPYQKIFKQMKAEVVRVYPWTEDFIKVACAWNGVCIFPMYDKCPVQGFTVKPTQHRLDIIQEQWETNDHVANPIANKGRTM
jgi:thymidylate synthase ThyX